MDGEREFTFPCTYNSFSFIVQVHPSDSRWIPVTNAKAAIVKIMVAYKMLVKPKPTWARYAGNIDVTLNSHRYANDRLGAHPFRQNYQLQMLDAHVVG